MSCSPTGVIDLILFHPRINETITLNAPMSPMMIKEADKVHLLPAIQTWLIKRLGTFTIIGYARETVLDGWFDRETMIEEFDELYLEFRDFLRLEKGIDPDEPHTLIRFRDNLTFILAEGAVDEPTLNTQYNPIGKDCEPLELESDPFL